MEFSNNECALLVMDMQEAIVNRLHSKQQLVDNVRKAISTAHKSGIPVIYAIVDFRPGMPEISANNKVFGGSKARAAGRTATSNDMNICSAITPSHEDIIVIKRRVSAFTGSDLDLLLRSIGVKNIILTGVATGGVVLSTLCEAADKDYSVTVLSDACADYNEEVHHFLIEKVFPFQSTVKTLTEFEAND